MADKKKDAVEEQKVDMAEDEELDEATGTDAKNAKDAKAAKAAKADKSAPEKAKKKKEGFFKRVAKFFRDLRGECKKIIWPTMSTVARNTGVTLAMCAILGLAICAFDFGLSFLVKLMVPNA